MNPGRRSGEPGEHKDHWPHGEGRLRDGRLARLPRALPVERAAGLASGGPELESTNGTFVNGKIDRAGLEQGDELGVGRVMLQVEKGALKASHRGTGRIRTQKEVLFRFRRLAR